MTMIQTPTGSGNLELVRDAERKGGKLIQVDGVTWGRIHMDYHGSHGASYWFSQAGCGSTRILDDNPKWPKPVTVYGDKIHVRRIRIGHPDQGAPNKSVAARLLDKAAELIAAGKLQHPDAHKVHVETQRKRWADAERKVAADRRAKDTKRVRAILDRFCIIRPDQHVIVDALVDLINTCRIE